ncbi:hypothetical protein OC834_005696 [Tilletia horrida]|nr:hypothetical protein OC834_005696 [Tilletia horrida]
MIEPPLIRSSSRSSIPPHTTTTPPIHGQPNPNYNPTPAPATATATATATAVQQTHAITHAGARTVNHSLVRRRRSVSSHSRPNASNGTRTPGIFGTSRRSHRSWFHPSTLVSSVAFFLILFGTLIALSGSHGVYALSVPTAGDSGSLAAPLLLRADAVSTAGKRSLSQQDSPDALARGSSDPALTPIPRSTSDQTPIHSSNHFLSPRQEPAAGAGEGAASNDTCSCNKGESIPTGEKVGFGILMPLLVLLSGLFAGLTLGYMSLDETQLQVLAAQGTPKQRADAAKITSVTKDRHLLLTTLLIANMITNETLPVIADPLLGGGVQAVIVSTVLVIIFAELIPQSVCARYGLVVGAAMVWPTRIIIFVLYPIAWPVSRILHYLLGAHSGIVYRRAELKELVTMHAAENGKGGDLKGDTIMIVGGALDLQEKVVKDAMTPIDKVFMLPYSAKLDYPTLERVVRSGHSRIPIYQEFEVPVATRSGTVTPSKKPSLLANFARKASMGNSATNSPKLGPADEKDPKGGLTVPYEMVTRKKILGTLLVKSCVLLDPEDATPISDMVINAIPTVPGDEPLLNVLNVFQEGRSHMAIVSSRSRRILGDGVADVGSKSSMFKSAQAAPGTAPRTDGLSDIDEEKQLEMVNSKDDGTTVAEEKSKEALEIEESFSGPDSPIGIITLEDVLEELIGEEIWDEYDTVNGRPADFARLSPPPSPDSKGRDPDMQLTQASGGEMAPLDGKDGTIAEKAANDDHPTVIHNDQAQQQEAAVGTAPKTVLQRLGLGRARSLRDSDSGTERSSNISSVAAVDGSPNPAGKATLQVGSVQPPRSLSSKATLGSSDTNSVSLGGAGAGGAQTGAGAGLTGLGVSGAGASAPPSSGTSVRPVIVRSTTASGQTSTAMAVLPETLLRGRRPGAQETQPLPPGSVVQLGTPGVLNVPSPLLGSTVPASGDHTRSSTPLNAAGAGAGGAASAAATTGGAAGVGGASTPSGPRANRFKSTPVPRPAVRARSMGPGAIPPTSPSVTAADTSGGGAGGGLDQSIVSLSALSTGTADAPAPATFVASPPAIEPETAPLDASIASLASLGTSSARKDGKDGKTSSG